MEQLLARDLGSSERRALRTICETSDIQQVGRRRFLVAPIGREIELVLHLFEAEREDLDPSDKVDADHNGQEDDSCEETDLDAV
ncbi:MAG: hypothetical protein AAF495_08500 [Pseudomonadota bacterium]